MTKNLSHLKKPDMEARRINLKWVTPDQSGKTRGAFPYETQRKRVHQPSERKRARRPESHFDQRGGGGEVPAHPQAGEKEDGRPDLRAPRGHHRHGRMGRSGPLNLAKDPGTASPL